MNIVSPGVTVSDIYPKTVINVHHRPYSLLLSYNVSFKTKVKRTTFLTNFLEKGPLFLSKTKAY